MTRTFLAAMALAALTAQPLAAADVTYHSSGAFEAQNLPFTEAVEAAGLVFLSGQIGVKPGTLELVEGGIEAEARQTMDNIGATLAAADLTFADVIKCTVMLADMADWPAFNEVYVEYFDAPYPARSAFGASGLALGGSLEVECIAARP
ncbi:MAG: RidA family protein [Candidatus Phaeomarinobacter sp.]